MKNKKWRIEHFSLFSQENMQNHLEKMAEEGWLLENINSFLWRYRRIEPAKLRFQIVYYQKKADRKYEESLEEKQLFEAYETQGWKVAAITSQMHIFYHELEGLKNVEIDLEKQLEGIHDVAFMNRVIPNLFFLFFCICFAIVFLKRSEIIPIKGTRSIGIIGNTLIAVASVFEIVGYYLWERRAKKAIQNGEQPSLKKIIWGKVNLRYLLMIGIICMGVMVWDSVIKWMLVGLQCLWIIFTELVDGHLHEQGKQREAKCFCVISWCIFGILTFILIS